MTGDNRLKGGDPGGSGDGGSSRGNSKDLEQRILVPSRKKGETNEQVE